MKEFGHIFLSWRKGSGHPRHIVGRIKRNATEGVSFEYIQEGVQSAKPEGFVPYTEFPELGKVYSHQVLESFGQRLIKSERSDIKDFLDFWDIDERHKEDKLYMLAHTQGLSPSDNFEFLADFNPIKKLRFTTDLAGLSHSLIPPQTVEKGDLLFIKRVRLKEDPLAVAVYKAGTLVGYIKKIHSRVFHKPGGEDLQVKVKSVEKNGVIKKIFVSISKTDSNERF